MSSESQRPNSTFDVCVVGDGGEAAYAAYLFAEAEIKVVQISSANPAREWQEVITIGNGDLLRRAELAIGEKNARELWQISKKNAGRATQLFSKLKLPTQKITTFWIYDSKNETEMAEASAKSDVTYHRGNDPRLGKFVSEKSESFDPTSLITRLKAAQSWPILRGEFSTLLRSISCERTLILDDAITLKLSPSMKEELIPVTLSLFEEPLDSSAPQGYFLFHSGADYALTSEGKIVMGSFRNLYEDKAVGRLAQYDPVTWKGVSQFFSKKKWMRPHAQPSSFYLKAASLSCDGLPLVGPLRDSPALFISTGYAARAANFQFEVLAQLVNSLAQGGTLDSPLTSNRRFL